MNIINLIKSIFQTKKAIQQHLRTACEIVENIKNALDSDKVQKIVDMIPGRFDNKTLSALKIIVTKALSALHIANNGVYMLPSTIEEIKKVEDKGIIYRSIAGQIVHDLTKIRLDTAINEADMFYQINKEAIKKAATIKPA